LQNSKKKNYHDGTVRQEERTLISVLAIFFLEIDINGLAG